MAIWICRAGKEAIFIDRFIKDKKIYCTWDGFDFDLHTKGDLVKELIKKEHPEISRTTLSNWYSQLNIFGNKMKVGDWVVAPNNKSRTYNIGLITGNYLYSKDAGNLKHSRDVEWKYLNVSKSVFSQAMLYSMGAFRTIFSIKNEEEFLSSIEAIEEGK